MAQAQKITPSLWFDNNCEEAMNFYVDTFNGSPNKRTESKIVTIKRYEEGMKTPGIEQMVGKVLTGIFELEGMRFIALDGGPIFKFTPSISFAVECKNQMEVDYFFEKMSAVPEAEICGWLTDKYGMSWQIVPKILGELMENPNPEVGKRVINALLTMKKIDIKGLEDAAGGN